MKKYLEEAAHNLDGFDLETLEGILLCIHEAIAARGKVLVCGNGGSAADASHLAGELVGRFRLERRALPVVALTVDPAVMTALANDYGYESVFARQVEALGCRGDVLLAITTSGASPNVTNAAQAAAALGMKVVAFTAAGREAPWAHLHWRAPSTVTSHAQEAMLVAFHALCLGLEESVAKT
ncbi:MAG: SIS domain-containing protein [Candidatus Fermentibacteraceae bacterium]